jgi:ABC-2 type transport system permease protein
MTTLTTPVPAKRTRARFRDLLTAEWIKLWSLRSTYWVLGLGTLLMIAGAVQGSTSTYNEWPTWTPFMKAHFYPTNDAFGVFAAFLVMIGAGSLGALTIVGEYSSGLIRTTFAAVPDRRRVVAAKVAVVAVVMLAVGILIATATFGVSQAILSGRHAGVSIGHPGIPRVVMANALLAPVSALVGMAFGALIRHTAATIVTVCLVLVVLPSAFNMNVHHWADDMYNAFPFYVWTNCLRMPHPINRPYFPTVTGSWIVFAAWPLVAAIVTGIVVNRRDV